MAVYTPVGDAELAQFLQDYDLGAATKLEPIAAGVENTNYFLDTEGGAHVLTVFERRTPEKDLPYFLGLTEHLRDRGVPCPRPRRRRDGALIGRLADKAAAIVERLPGRTMEAPTEADCSAGGETLARMHLAATDFASERVNPLGAAGVGLMLRRLAPAISRLEEGLGDEIDEAGDALDLWAAAPLPAGAAHTDFFPDNALYDAGALTGVIDFYFAADEAFAYDLAVTLVSWCWSGTGLDAGKVDETLRAYQSVRPLLPEERDALPALARAACLRFFATRLYDLEHPRADAMVTNKDPLEYVAKLRFLRALEEI